MILVWVLLFMLGEGTPASAIHSDSPPEIGHTIEGQLKLPERGAFNSARVSLYGNDGLEYTGLVRQNGGFHLRGVDAGSYTLEVDFPGYFFTPISLEVEEVGRVRASSTFRKEKVQYPLLLRPSTKAQYFVQRPPWNIKGMLMNPTVIMMGIMGVMVFAFPKLADTMAEEQKRQAATVAVKKTK